MKYNRLNIFQVLKWNILCLNWWLFFENWEKNNKCQIKVCMNKRMEIILQFKLVIVSFCVRNESFLMSSMSFFRVLMHSSDVLHTFFSSTTSPGRSFLLPYCCCVVMCIHHIYLYVQFLMIFLGWIYVVM